MIASLVTQLENPFAAAQRFLQANDLPLSYVDQIVNFIERNTGGVHIGRNEEFVDPFTGDFTFFLRTELNSM
jgi:hypothetical protein